MPGTPWLLNVFVVWPCVTTVAIMQASGRICITTGYLVRPAGVFLQVAEDSGDVEGGGPGGYGWQPLPLKLQPLGAAPSPPAMSGTISAPPGGSVSPPDTACSVSVRPLNCQAANGPQAPG